MKAFWQRHRFRIIVATLWAGVALTVVLVARANQLSWVAVLRQSADLLTHPFYGPIVFMLLYAFRPILLLPSTILTLSGGALFGVMGVLWSLIGSNGGAFIAYWLAYIFGRDPLTSDEHANSVTTLQTYIEQMRANPFEAVLIMRLINLPYDLVSYLAGFLRVNWRQFLLGSILGGLPGTTAVTLFAASLDFEEALSGKLPSFNLPILLLSILILLVTILISRAIRLKRNEPSQTG